jgi:dTDP-4-dehydrorhamnose reductase
MSKRVLILGVTGMLGHACFEYFNNSGDFETFGTWRNPPEKQTKSFDVFVGSIGELVNEVKPDWIINCIGVIKQKIDEANQTSVENVFRINEEFSKELADAVAGTGVKVIQIATDCVFDGGQGRYTELSPHDALDLYGRSKSLGEVSAPEFMNLRVSIIGREVMSNFSLVDWFLSQDYGAEVNGYTNHLWNGITTIAFTRIAAGIIRNNKFTSGTFHIIPNDDMSKYELLQQLRKYFSREDILISPVNAPTFVDRSLRTIYPEINRNLWQGANYNTVPSIEALVEELSFTS